MEPVRAEVTPRAGAWVEADRLRAAVKQAGFKPEEIRYTITGRLQEWQGQPAVSFSGSDRLVLLQAEPKAAQPFDQARQCLQSGSEKTAEVEGRWVDGKKDPAAPAALRLLRLRITD